MPVNVGAGEVTPALGNLLVSASSAVVEFKPLTPGDDVNIVSLEVGSKRGSYLVQKWPAVPL